MNCHWFYWQNKCSNMTIHIAIVSHGHKDIIEEVGCLPFLAGDSLIKVWLLDNIGEAGLKLYCEKHNVNYLKNDFKKGFGTNNNIIFSYIEKKISFTKNDCFLILNPDVSVELADILDIVNLAEKSNSELTTLNLYKDKKLSVFDDCVRKFPAVYDFISSYAGLGNKTIIDKSKITEAVEVDWAAGSFLLFKASLYRKLGGFDPNYFMYCEDIDICWRAQKIFGEKLMFFPQIKAIHHAQHANRSLFSKHFVWHVKSMIRYLLLFYGLRKPYKKNNNENRL